MNALRPKTLHFTKHGLALKLIVLAEALFLGAPSDGQAPASAAPTAPPRQNAGQPLPRAAAPAQTPPAQQTGERPEASLNAELAGLLRAGQIDEAVQRAQQALRDRPDDPDVRREFIDLHLALARDWLGKHRYADAIAALDAVRAADPANAVATRLLEELAGARDRAARQIPEIDRLLKLELFEPALDLVREVQALRPELASDLAERERIAWLGAADDHYLARNFNEAFALYESFLVQDANAATHIYARWAVSLTLALAATDASKAADPAAARRLLSRAAEVLPHANEPLLSRVLQGLLAEAAGETISAGQEYAAAVGVTWELPPVDQRRRRVAELRAQALRRAEEIYKRTPVARRDGFWAVALTDSWKPRQTPHFDVYARNDVIAERIAQTAEYHLAGISAWLGAPVAAEWQPRCEIRVHATRDGLQAATGTQGSTFAVSRTQVQGDRVLLRKLEVFQADPWLLSSTLPHEITHLIIAEWRKPAALPLALEEGLALDAEPPARRLMYRRLLDPNPPSIPELLAVATTPQDSDGFYAQAGALTGWVLDCLTRMQTPTSQSVSPRLNEVRSGFPPGTTVTQPATGRAAPSFKAASQPANVPIAETDVARLLAIFGAGVPPQWWRTLGFDTDAAASHDWAEWYAARRDPPRMPLMILTAADNTAEAAPATQPGGDAMPARKPGEKPSPPPPGATRPSPPSTPPPIPGGASTEKSQSDKPRRARTS